LGDLEMFVYNFFLMENKVKSSTNSFLIP
jgi:hypothetical protein